MDEIFAVGCAVLLMGGAAAIVKIVETVSLNWNGGFKLFPGGKS